MKKIALRFLMLCCCLFLVCCRDEVDLNAIDVDCEYLKTIFEEASVDISKTIDEGLDSAKLIEDIKAEYVLQIV